MSLAGGRLSAGKTNEDHVPASHLHSLRDLLASPYARPVLQKLRAESEHVVEHIKKQMREEVLLPKSRAIHGREWGVRVGFHAVPSMDTVHLHVSLFE